MKEVDCAIVGGGIVGLAHAWMAARRGLTVLLLERSQVAQGASVRNFGMIWPIGQPGGEPYAIALRSRRYWKELGEAGVVEVEQCGSIHVAHHPDELAVLEEFSQLSVHDVTMLSADEVQARAPLVNPTGLQGGMWSETELRVNPRVACARIAKWLSARHSVECCYDTQVTAVEGSIVRAADGRNWRASRIIVCSGSDLQTLFPEMLQQSGLNLCKLQMLRSVPQPESMRQSVHLASGLTLRHYTAFHICPTLPELKARIAQESPELDRYGIHVMASPFPNGEVILGDSHEYGAEITPFDKTEIDALMIRELKKVFRLGDWSIQDRWHGIYAKHPTRTVVEEDCGDGVHVFVGPGGAGMTMSFGLAERAWRRWLRESNVESEAD